jgi:hypothetical protein
MKGQGWLRVCEYPTDVAQVHPWSGIPFASPKKRDVCHINPFTLQILLLVWIWNSTKVLENVRCGFC